MDENTQSKNVTTATLVKSSFWYTVSSFLTRAMVFITTPIFTRILTKADYGSFTVYASWQNIFVIVLGLEIYNTLNRARFDYPNKKDFDGYITSCLTLSTIITAVAFALFLIFPSVFQDILLLDRKFIFVMFAYLFTFPAYLVFQTKQRIEYRYKLNAGIAFVLVMASSILAVVLALLMDSDPLFGRVIGQYGLYVIAGAAFYFFFLKQSVSVKLSDYKYALKIAIPLVFSFLASSILLSSDGLIVKHMCSDEQVSYISLTHTIANIMILFVQVLNNAWSPWFYDKLNVKEYPVIRKTYKGYVLLVTAGTLGVLLLAPEIILILGGKQYMEALDIIPIVIINGVFSALTFQFVNYETFYKKAHYSAAITSVVALLNIGLDIVGVILFDYRAVCYATAICQIILILIHYFVTRKMGIEDVLPLKDVLLFIALTIVLVGISMVIYLHDAIRFGCLGLCVVAGIVIILKNRAKLLQFAAKFRNKK